MSEVKKMTVVYKKRTDPIELIKDAFIKNFRERKNKNHVMRNTEKLYQGAAAARNFLAHNREDYVVTILMEQHGLSHPQATEAIKIAKNKKSKNHANKIC